MATLIQSLEHILASKDPSLRMETKRVVLKEALQAYILDFLYNHPLYRRLNFYGGTCLHMVYNLNRLSEDLDLDNSAAIDLTNLGEELSAYIRQTLGYKETAWKSQQGGEGILRITLKFPVLNALGLSPHPDEALHLKVEISQHKQTALIKRTPVIYYGRSFVTAHFSLETMMAGKMITCLEREFRVGKSATLIKGRDFYDLLWFMQKHVQPLEEKLARDGDQPYTVRAAMLALKEKAASIRPTDLAVDLVPMFESEMFVKAWVESFHDNFNEYLRDYVQE
jgi:hypothetical protein